VKWKW